MTQAEQSLSITQQLLTDAGFKDRHRTAPKYFSRSRILTFRVMLLLMLQKRVKSMQLLLNELSLDLVLPLVTSSAYSQARSHLKAEAFIELHQKAVVELFYQDADYQTYHGLRVLAIDGSKVYLPLEKEIVTHFGGTVENQHSDTIVPYGMLSQLYDVLNNIPLDVTLAPAKAYEVELAISHHLSVCQDGDVVLIDRNYPSYLCLASFMMASETR